MARVAFEHVEKVYAGGTRALIDCSLEVDDGELLVLVGPSGCGKSTLLRLLAGLEAPTRGAIRIDGRDVVAESPQARNVAMVFQDYALYPHMTVRENLAFPLRMRRLPRHAIDTRVAETAELLELGALLDRLPRQLSGGQRQRVAMGRALVREPAAFLLDEPLSNLDARLRGQVRAEIESLQRRTGTTMLYVTHDQVEAMTLGDRVAVLHDGRLQQVAPPRELYERPANAFVAGFIGSPPMNLFAARIAHDASGRPALAVAGASLALPDALIDAARARDGATVTAGLRPEWLALVGARDPGALPARVEQVELLGHESLIHLRVGGDLRWIARSPGISPLATGVDVGVRVTRDAAAFFD